jgi:hypothetical protein
VRDVRVIGRDPLVIEVEHTGGTDRLALDVPMAANDPFVPREIGVSLKRGGVTWQVGSGPDGGSGYERGTVVACDYEQNAITVEGLAPDGLAGRFVRLFTENRSSAYQILSAEAVAEGTRLQLDQTSLLFEALIDGFEDGRLQNAASVLHWTEREDEEGDLVPWRLWNRDAALVSEDGRSMQPIRAVAEGRTIYLQGAPSAEELRAQFTDANGDGRILAYAHDYAIGARVEVARVEHTEG